MTKGFGGGGGGEGVGPLPARRGLRREKSDDISRILFWSTSGATFVTSAGCVALCCDAAVSFVAIALSLMEGTAASATKEAAAVAVTVAAVAARGCSDLVVAVVAVAVKGLAVIVVVAAGSALPSIVVAPWVVIVAAAVSAVLAAVSAHGSTLKAEKCTSWAWRMKVRVMEPPGDEVAVPTKVGIGGA